jgi:CelD/BcsL family acetyltransferase involved in cellulose biosynthesis
VNRGDDTATVTRPTTAAETSEELSLHVISDESAFAALGEEWNSLVIESRATVYQTHEWASLWWKHFGGRPHQQLHCLLLRANGLVVGIVPLYEEQVTVLGIPAQRRLALMGEGTAFSVSSGMFFDNGPSDYLDAIVRPGCERAVARAVARHLSGLTFDLLELVNVPEESMIRTSLLPELDALHYFCRAAQADVCPYLPLPSSMEEVLGTMSASVRRRFVQAMRASEGAEAMFTVTKASTLEEFSRAFETIVGLHQRRWNKVGYPGLFADKRFKDFQEAVLRAFHARGWLWCSTAVASGGAGEAVASRLAFMFNGCLYDYLSGFDDAAPAAKRRPGLALLMRMIEEGIASSMGRVDFLRGDEPYKFEMTSASRHNWNITARRSAKQPLPQRLLLAARLGGFLLRRERSLLGVQRREHGLFGSVGHYVRFRAPRLTKKLEHLRTPTEQIRS